MNEIPEEALELKPRLKAEQTGELTAVPVNTVVPRKLTIWYNDVGAGAKNSICIRNLNSK